MAVAPNIKKSKEDFPMKKIKPWMKYIMYIILICLLVFLREYVGMAFKDYFGREFRTNFFLALLMLLISAGLGSLLGLEYLTGEMKKEGRWRVNLSKLTFVGLPSLYVSLTSVLMSINNQTLLNIIFYPLMPLFRFGSGFVTIFQLILGYILITSFYKQQK